MEALICFQNTAALREGVRTKSGPEKGMKNKTDKDKVKGN